jgi:hypothetical protein
MVKIEKLNKLEELPMREYAMYALGASHAENFEQFTSRFKEIFLSQPERLNPEDHKNNNLDELTKLSEKLGLYDV